jgi:hypothetical protein
LKKALFAKIKKKIGNFEKNEKRARARAKARAGERASQSWPKLAENNPI